MSIHLTIKNKNRPNPRTATPEKKTGPFLPGGSGWEQIFFFFFFFFVVENKDSAGVKNLVKRDLCSRL